MSTWVRIRDEVRTREQIVDVAARAASGFASLGTGPGDVVTVYMRNDFALMEASIGAGMTGAYVTPANWHSTPEEARYVFENSGAKAIVIHADLLRGVEGALPAGVPVLVAPTPEYIREAYNILPEACAVPDGYTAFHAWAAGFAPKTEDIQAPPGAMIYTSGTTGHPKGVRRQPAKESDLDGLTNMARIIGGLTDYVERPHEITAMIVAPAYHSSPNGWIFGYFNNGANLVLEPKFDPENTLAMIEKHKVTHIHMVPTMFVRMLALPDEIKRKYDVSSLRFVMHVGAPCPIHVKRGMIDWWGPVIHEHYGSTEVGAITYCDSHDWLAHPGTVGRAIAGAQILVVGEGDTVLERGAAGEILCRCDFYPDFTYHGDDAKRRKAERLGLISIGDVGYLDEDGFLYLSGRANDMIIFGGSNIYPAEIEAELLKIAGVADCAVFGIPHPDFGEQVCAHIQMAPGFAADRDAIMTELREKVASYKLPRVVEFSAQLPREDTGKIFKRKLREPYWEGTGRNI
jgi:long-chain acyl-CoA synthetase